MPKSPPSSSLSSLLLSSSAPKSELYCCGGRGTGAAPGGGAKRLAPADALWAIDAGRGAATGTGAATGPPNKLSGSSAPPPKRLLDDGAFWGWVDGADTGEGVGVAATEDDDVALANTPLCGLGLLPSSSDHSLSLESSSRALLAVPNRDALGWRTGASVDAGTDTGAGAEAANDAAPALPPNRDGDEDGASGAPKSDEVGVVAATGAGIGTEATSATERLLIDDCIVATGVGAAWWRVATGGATAQTSAVGSGVDTTG